MKKIITFILIIISTISLISCDSNKTNNEINLDNYIDSLLTDTTSYIPSWNKESFKGRWNYIDGVFLNSIVNLYEIYKDSDTTKAESYKDFFINYINYYIDEDGTFINPKTGAEAYLTTELDSVCESRILFDAYNITNDSRYVTGINYAYTNLINMDIVDNSNGNFSHKESYLDQIWLDGMYMYAPFYVRYGISTNNLNILDIVTEQYRFVRDNMFDETKKLYYHGYSSTGIFWSDDVAGCSKSFWLRSMGWYMVSLVDILDYYPDGDNKTYLAGLLSEALMGVLEYQDSDSKMFYQVVDQGNKSFSVSSTYLKNLKNTAYMVNGSYVDTTISNYLESSGSSMIAYALMKSAKKGYIDSSYLSVGKEIFEGIYNHSFDSDTNTLNDICITAGLGPESKTYRDGTIAYYLAEPVGSNDAKGVGPFLMAYIEYKYDSKILETPSIS